MTRIIVPAGETLTPAAGGRSSGGETAQVMVGVGRGALPIKTVLLLPCRLICAAQIAYVTQKDLPMAICSDNYHNVRREKLWHEQRLS